MSYFGIDHKLRVFISSKCGGKYTIARKALKALLETTGLVETYVFETEPASSEDTISAYLESVDQSNLCIFLIDNADGVPPAVLSEEKRAKDKGLRLLYIFCDESKKEPTSMQDEIKTSLSQKYFVVHEFSDIVQTAYDSAMQDIIAVYKRKENPLFGENTDQENSLPLVQQSITDTYSMPKRRYPQFPLVNKTLTGKLYSDTRFGDKPQITELDQLLSTHLQFVLRKTSFDENSFQDLRNEIIKIHDSFIQNLINKRFDAQFSYYRLNYEESLAHLQDALKMAVDDNAIPCWVANDIAIDIRHVYRLIDEQKSRISFYNPGQKYIDKSEEPVYFPYLDRHAENMQEEIAKKYYTQLNISPYTTTFGGLEKIFSPLANVFCIAEINGSIVQTEIIKERIISIYLMLSTLYDDHGILLELIRLLIINHEQKGLDTVVRTREQSIEMLNSSDIRCILEDIETIPNTTHQMMSKYLLASRFGYYMDDESYLILCDELVNYALAWAVDCNKNIYLSSYIFDFFRENIFRADSTKTIDFIMILFENKSARFYDDCFKIIRNIDFAQVPVGHQRKIRQLLTDLAAKRIQYHADQYFVSAIIRFCRTATIPFKRLENYISRNFSTFYEDTFRLEMSALRNESLDQFINAYLEEAHSRNATQGINGTYSGYSHESYDVIYNIICFNHIKLNDDTLHNILASVIDTLATKNQTVQAKISAIRLMQLLYLQYKENDIWTRMRPQLIDNMPLYTTGYETAFFDRSSSNILAFAYDLLICDFSEIRVSTLLEKVFLLKQSDSYEAIQFLKIITDYLTYAHTQNPKSEMLSAFLFFSMSMSQHREKDVKYHATRCLIELTNYNSTKNLALMYLSQIMDEGSQSSKIAIITRIHKISANDDSYIKQIINKGKADCNYLVRLISNREGSMSVD